MSARPNNTEAAAVSVIIPARNEERNLPVLLQSLRDQSMAPGQVIVVDDHSTDATAAVARQFGAQVINPPPLPAGWRGKTWACHQGAQAATGRWLLFLDADTWLEPGGAFSVGPYHVMRQPYEQFSLFFNLNMAAGTVPDGLFGQMLLVERSAYERVGGHGAVAGRILENFSLAERFRSAGVPVRSQPGRGLVCFRMYPNGLGELVAGWTKAFAAGAGQTDRGKLLGQIVWLIGLMLAVILPLVTPWALVAYGVGAAQVARRSREIGNFSWASALLYPVPLLFFFVVFTRSALRSGKQVAWKGRSIRAD